MSSPSDKSILAGITIQVIIAYQATHPIVACSAVQKIVIPHIKGKLLDLNRAPIAIEGTAIAIGNPVEADSYIVVIAIDHVVAGPSEHRVLAATAKQHIIAGIPHDHIVTQAAGEPVAFQAAAFDLFPY
ncbi:hypothetical protein D3C84_728520 [compost metagenome]